MRVVVGIVGVALILVMLSEFFVAFLLPRRVRRDPRIARGLSRLLWLPWRALSRRLPTATADTWLGFFGPFALLFQLIVWTLGLMVGYGLLEWGTVGGAFGGRLLSSSGVFLSAESPSGSTAAHLIGLLEAATGVGVVFIVIGYLPAVYSSFSQRETAVSQLATRAGSPPAAGVLLNQAIGRQQWEELKRELGAWEEWAAELMETHLSYPLLGFYRSQHVNQNWLAALTAMVDVAAFVKATAPQGKVVAADVTFAIGRHALADLALQFRLAPGAVQERLSRDDFDHLYTIVEAATDDSVDRECAHMRLRELRQEYEPNAEALGRFFALDLPRWLPADRRESVGKPGVGVGGYGRDLVGQPSGRKVRERDSLEDRP
ncbi:MAG: hypothetical protein E6G19_06375 [Actinobacteria bacterium]|nr:MAG: hypothetical protein E6G19_06375 [Actinomycetota bacterium]